MCVSVITLVYITPFSGVRYCKTVLEKLVKDTKYVSFSFVYRLWHVRKEDEPINVARENKRSLIWEQSKKPQILSVKCRVTER
jgi:hypothetical protein